MLAHRFNWKRASMAAACCYRSDGGAAELVFGIRAGSYNEDSLIEFVEELHAHLAGQKVILLWEGAALASQQEDEGLPRLPAILARGRGPAPPTLPSSTPSRSCGPISRAGSWRTSAAKPRRAGPNGPARRRAVAQRRGSALRLPESDRTLALCCCLDLLKLHCYSARHLFERRS